MKRFLLFLVVAVAALLFVVPIQTAQASVQVMTDTLLIPTDSLPLLFMVGALSSVAFDPSSSAIGTDTLREWFNKFVSYIYYTSRNGVISTTVATLPLVATAGTATKVKTTNATVVKNAGVANAVAASDDAWTLTGAALAIGSFRRYLLLVSSADAFTVLASNDAASAAACEFPRLPADGLAIVGILTLSSTAVFTPATTAISDAAVTEVYTDGHEDDAVFRLGGKLVSR